MHKTMSESANSAAGAGHRPVALLTLVATPVFAIMGLVTAVMGGLDRNILCSAGQDSSPLNGMVPMYVLMSLFHSAPWLMLVRSGISK